jgi:hypothetical protein
MYRAELEGKHQITWLTEANHCEQEAARFREAALRAGGRPSFER